MTTPGTTTPQNHDTAAGPILVVGATGKTGRRVADILDARGIANRRASRSSATAFDWSDRSTWAPALDGVVAAYITYQPDLVVPAALGDIGEFVRLADAAGVRRLVLLAGRGEAEADAAGRVVHDAAAESTVLSCAWFDQNFSEGPFAEELAQGSLTLAVAPVGEPFIDTDDIAEVAVAALVDTTEGINPHAGQTYELTGPRLLTFADAAAEIATAQGRHIEYTAVPPEVYRGILLEVGVPEPEVDLILTLLGTLFDGRNASVTGDVERVLGRPARDFADYAADVVRGGAVA
ncbi:hypothetical protein [Gordonia soli]|uniref:NAD(P)-binding domain-containing protein n=1 Tax=Gordonia soli NBRC 108243 TaxID=1223545 RepID=M0QPF9_9ACTN|nr:hypothetical protein [Gordonia soli]GAC70555.1 hypothetical protein GS4_36_00410 [Gordonia soli NBRC 108243]